MDSCSGVYWSGVPQPKGAGRGRRRMWRRSRSRSRSRRMRSRSRVIRRQRMGWISGGEVKSTIQCKEILWNQGNKYSKPCS